MHRGSTVTLDHEAIESQVATVEGDGNRDEPTAEVHGEGVIQVVDALDDDFGGLTQRPTGEQSPREVTDDLQIAAVETKREIAGIVGFYGEFEWSGGSRRVQAVKDTLRPS